MLLKTEISCISALMSDRLSYYPLIDRIEKETLILNDDGCLLIEDEKLRRLYVIAADLEAFLRVFTSIDYARYDLIISYNRQVAEHLIAKRDDFEPEITEAYVYTYRGDGMLRIENADIRCLDEGYFDIVFANYRYAEADELHAVFAESSVFGLFDDGELAGFIGMHNDGTMGMLEVFEPYRKKGYGYQLEAFLINHQLKSGKVPYCNVEVTNKASIALQKKLNMKKGEQIQYWIFKKDE